MVESRISEEVITQHGLLEPKLDIIEQYQNNIIELFAYNKSISNQLMDDQVVENLNLITTANIDLCTQYYELIQQNNLDSNNNSMILRSLDEIMNSKEIVMIEYNGLLLGAIRIQQQESVFQQDNQPIYQRGSLIVHPDFRKDSLGGINLMKILIQKINNIALSQELPVYGIGKRKSMIELNISIGSVAININNLKILSEEFYEYIVMQRGGEDFKDMNSSELVSDYMILLNKYCLKLLKGYSQ